jgi:hypothetical protein
MASGAGAHSARERVGAKTAGTPPVQKQQNGALSANVARGQPAANMS